jgi:hypothetical protein
MAAVGVAVLMPATGCAASPTSRIEVDEDKSTEGQTIDPGSIVMVLSAAPTQTLADGSVRETG